MTTDPQRDPYQGRELCCRQLLLLPTCIRRQKRKPGERVSARAHSGDRDSNQWCCEESVAVRASQANRRSAIAGGFAAYPEWRLETALSFGQPPTRLPMAVRPAANRSPESRVRFQK